MDGFVEEHGEVIAAGEGTAKIKLQRHASCDKCGACGMGKRPEIVVEAEDPIGVETGDIVMLRMKTGQLFKAAVLMYTFPLVGLILGFLAGQGLALWGGLRPDSAENIGILTGFIILAGIYMAIRWWDRRYALGKKIRPEIVGVIGSIRHHSDKPLK
ncbi:MAG TPA: SoxR reducing system RseC family protein [Bacillota bacterium]|nr:SoxR reducing system RseC family protein [Bacillota bacterium]